MGSEPLTVPPPDAGRPPRHLHLEPGLGPAADIGTRLVLGDEPLVAAGQHLSPGVQPTGRETPHRMDAVGIREEVFQPRSPLAQGLLADVAALEVEGVEGDQDRRRGEFIGRIAEAANGSGAAGPALPPSAP